MALTYHPQLAHLVRVPPEGPEWIHPKGAETTVGGIRISNADREVYPDIGLTKQAIAAFFERMGPRMLPHLAGRPLTLVRCPDGIGNGCFFVKHSKAWAPPPIRRVQIREKTKVGEYLVVDGVPALIALAQMNVLEIHTWNSRVDRLECPDRLLFDLDPGRDVPWGTVVDAARRVRRLLQDVGLEGFPKTTGGKGLHVVVPLRPTAGWQASLTFARAIAETLERHHPDRFTTAFRKAGREQKILVDYLRNNRANTSVAAFSPRARAGAPVSMPLRWSDVTTALKPQRFTVLTAEKRLARLEDDPWAAYWTTRQRLSPRMTETLTAR
jgi:bifunctional non-homologous end joining protein LigD